MLVTEPHRVDRAIEPGRRFAAELGHEEFTVRGRETLARIRLAVREGNVLRIWIKDEDGRTLIEIPSLLGVRGGPWLAPVWAAVDALASVSRRLTVELRREAAWPRYAD